MIDLGHLLPTKKSRGQARHRVAEDVRDVRRNRRTKAGRSKKKAKHKPFTGREEATGLGILFALEPRIMFDGAALATGAEVVQDQTTQDSSTEAHDFQAAEADSDNKTSSNPLTDNVDLFSALSTVAVPSNRKEIVFIDTSVDDYQTLMEGIDPRAEVILLDSRRDGVEQMAEVLNGRTDIDAIHLISHGNQGELYLGTGTLSMSSMQGEYADELAIINQALTDEADWLVYGCNFGEGGLGKDAATLLSELTGADIAASNDLTGSVELGGDWDLEYQTGAIETQQIVTQTAQDLWAGLLAPGITVTPTSSLATTESGGTDAITVVLDEAPTADVTISISSSDTTEGTVSTSSLTFGTLDWNIAQGVTITGVDDNVVDANAAYTIVTGPAVSADLGYNALNAADVSVHNFDNERTQNGIQALYLFEEGTGSNVFDVSGVGASLDLSIGTPANTSWLNGALSIDASTIVASGAAATKIYTSATATDALTVEAWVKADTTVFPDSAPHRIVSMSADTGNRNFTLGQNDSNETPANTYNMRLRTSIGGDLNGLPTVNTTSGLTGTTLNHVVMTHDAAGNEVIYVNGVSQYSGSRTGDFSNWDATYGLALANEATLNRAWLGDFHLVAIYDRALGAAEVTQNFNAGAGGNQIVVDTTSDVSDGDTSSIATLVSNKGADGFISLREAIIAANNTTGTDTINFNIAGAGPHTIQVGNPGDGGNGALPTITDAVVIDGYTQTGASANTLSVGNDAVLQIEIDGTSAGGGTSGLHITGGNSTVRGLAIHSFGGDGIALETNGGNLIEGNFIGTDVTGAALGLGNEDGVDIDSSSSTNTIGGITAATRNIISGNTDDGVDIDGVSWNIVIGNYIGTNAAGTGDLGNTNNGVFIKGGASNNIIGGATAITRNIISGNNDNGVYLLNSGTTNNQIQGNYIGTDVTGTMILGNMLSGVRMNSGASSNTIGGTGVGARNVISGNDDYGVLLSNVGTTNNVIEGNYIGTDVTGTLDIGNTLSGIRMNAGVASNRIGGTSAEARNVISGNNDHGVYLSDVGTSNNVIEGNFIGTDVTGMADLGNTDNGILLSSNSTGNTIGGTTTDHRNIVSGNNSDGIGLDNGADSNTVIGNIVGLDVNGTAILANNGDGIDIESDSNIIGGTTAGERNIVSGNSGDGFDIDSGNNNTIIGNYVGTDITGALDLGNIQNGIFIKGTSTGNTIGGTTVAARNIISGNNSDGIEIDNSSSNAIEGNYIGTDVLGMVDLGNTGDGVRVVAGASSNTIGGTIVGAGNLISGNNDSGIQFNGAGAAGNTIQGNYIGTNAAGTGAVSNSTDGVEILSSNNVTIGGTTASARNIISGNNDDGVNIDLGSTGVSVQGNYIGLDATGTSAIANADDGVLIEVGSPNNIIGGTAAARNFISGNGGDGIEVTDSDSNTIQGNIIGQGTNGTARGNTNHGIYIRNTSSNNLIGSITAGAGNTITNNGLDGIAGNSTGTGNAIQGNSIFNNAGLGIDLNDDGVTGNDTGDGDIGSNNLQNFPALNQAVTDGLSIALGGTVQSQASTTFRVEFFSTSTADSSGYGEGQTYLGFVNVTTDTSGNGNFSTLLSASVADGAFISATTTNLTTNDTSEFALSLTAIAVPPPPPPPPPDPTPDPPPEPSPEPSPEPESDPGTPGTSPSGTGSAGVANGFVDNGGLLGRGPDDEERLASRHEVMDVLDLPPFLRPGSWATTADQLRSYYPDPLAMTKTELSPEFLQQLNTFSDALGQTMDEQVGKRSLFADMLKGTGITLSAGFVAWLVRGGALLAWFLSSLPAWRQLDPIPILGMDHKDKQAWTQRMKETDKLEAREHRGLEQILQSGKEPKATTQPGLSSFS